MEDIKQKNDMIIGKQRFRSSIWPLILICVGVVWLLSNFGILQAANVVALVQLWPLLLIVGGFELLFGRTSPQLARMLGIGTLIFALAFMIVGPALGIGKVNVKTDRYTETLGEAVTANITLSPGIGKTTVSASNDSANLFDANVTYVGEINFSHAGDKDKSITLQGNGQSFSGLGWLSNVGSTDLHWNVSLNPSIPLSLNVKNGVGNSDLDLSKLKLTSLEVDGGVGNVSVALPASTTAYNSRIKGGVGNVRMMLPTDSDINLTVNGGTGNVDVTVPRGTAVQVIATGGLGNVNLDSNLDFTSQPSRGADHNGTYTTAGFDTAAHKIVINYTGGVGNFSIHS